MARNSKKRTKTNERLRLAFALLLVLALVFAVNYFMGDPLALHGPAPAATPARPAAAAVSPAPPAPTGALGGALDLYVLDVGQGDSIFLRGPSGKTMLVDAGTSGAFSRIDSFLQAQGVTKLDVVIATHPHADHIGGMPRVVESYEIGTYYMPDAQTSTQTFERLLDALLEREVSVVEAAAGENTLIEWEKDVEVRILSPLEGVAHKDLNDASVVCRVKYGETAAMLTGDAEAHAERRMLDAFPRAYFEAQILKLGHHGSSTSCCDAFLQAVKPEIAIASLGEDNTYGHPHQEILEAMEAYGILLYRTDLDGIVHVRMDGAGYMVKTDELKFEN